MRLKQFIKAARIPIRVRNGRIEFLYDNQLPPLQDGDWGELIVDINTVKDPAWQEFLVAEVPVLTADAGDFVAFRVATNKGSDAFEKHLISEQESALLRGLPEPKGSRTPAWFGDGHAVLGQLTAPLTINLRGENKSNLSDGAVEIPALRELKRPYQANSLN